MSDSGNRAPPASQGRSAAPSGSSPVPGLEQSRSSTGAAHTPGPWHFDGGADFTVHERNGNCLAEVYDSRANAHLIAAAPELYEALELFECQWNACGPNSNFGRYFQSVRDAAVAALSKANERHWLNTSAAALAKARGETA